MLATRHPPQLLQAGQERAPDLAVVNLSLAGMKQVRDILTGDLPFEEDIIRANDAAYVSTATGTHAGAAAAHASRSRR